MQHILKIYTFHTCNEIAQTGLLIVCLYPREHWKKKLTAIKSTIQNVNFWLVMKLVPWTMQVGHIYMLMLLCNTIVKFLCYWICSMCYKRFGANNLTFLIMYLVIVQGGLKDEHVSQRLNLGANGVIIFQVLELENNLDIVAICSICHRCALHGSLNKFCNTNFSNLSLVSYIENLLQCLHCYFSHSLKSYLEFTKLVENMELLV